MELNKNKNIKKLFNQLDAQFHLLELNDFDEMMFFFMNDEIVVFTPYTYRG